MVQHGLCVAETPEDGQFAVFKAGMAFGGRTLMGVSDAEGAARLGRAPQRASEALLSARGRNISLVGLAGAADFMPKLTELVLCQFH